MAIDSSTIAPTLQKVFLLMAGIPPDSAQASQLSAKVTADGNWGSVVQLLNQNLAGQASSIGAAALVTRMGCCAKPSNRERRLPRPQ